MKFKIVFLLSVFIVSLFFLAAPENAAAQARQRFPLSPGRGEAGKAVAGRVRGTIKGAAYRDYFFTIPKGRSIDVSVSTDTGETVKFDILSPKGKKLFEDTTEILDELPTRGTYTIRVYRAPDGGGGGKGGASGFQLAVFMYI